MMKLQNISVVLGSQSPRRRALIQDLGFQSVSTLSADINETIPLNLPVEQVPEQLAFQKMQALKHYITGKQLLITADTVVILNKQIIGKPKNLDEAQKILEQLSGNTHQVITGVCLFQNGQHHTFSEITHVTFSILTHQEIDYYVSNYQPTDKAGAYGIQEWIGKIGILCINGCYYNVMGLPLHRLYKEILNFTVL